MPRKIVTLSEQLPEKIRGFCDAVEAGDVPAPTDYELCRWLDVAASMLERMWEGEGEYKKARECLQELIAYRSHWCMMKGSTWSIFASKQKRWGGWTDKPAEDKTPIKIDISLTGAGSDWAK